MYTCMGTGVQGMGIDGHINSSICNTSSRHKGCFFNFLSIFVFQLKKRRLVPTNHTYTSLFKSFSESGHTSRPLLEKVVAEIDRRDVLLNTIATNSLMVAMTTCGMGAEEVFGVYGDMTKRGVAPDVSTFTTLLTTCSLDRERGMGMVEGVWREMMASGISPDLVCYHLCEGRLLSLAVRRRANRYTNLAGRSDLDRGALPESALETHGPRNLGRAQAAYLDVRRNTDSHVAAFGACLFLFSP